MLRYTVVLDPEPDGSAYTVTVPALPGVVTWGETIPEALAKAREAVHCHIAGFAQDGESFPVESPGLVITTVEVSDPMAKGLAVAS
jgi:predicted RNase H-like HicB family nuclease